MAVFETILTILKSRNLIEPNGKIKTLDSIEMIDVIVAIEKATSTSLPPSSLREEIFESVQTLSDVFEQFEKK